MNITSEYITVSARNLYTLRKLTLCVHNMYSYEKFTKLIIVISSP